MIDVNLPELQKEELKILSLCKEILDRHNLTFFLVAGSCLGAVRHQGFIPWDDDIDIALFRADYIKAAEVLKKELPNGYSYCDYFSEEDYPYNFAKVRKDNSAMVHGGDAHLKINQGIYIDLFPLDVTPDDYNSYSQQYRKVKLLKQCVDLAYMDYKKYGKRRPVYQIPMIFLAHLFVNKKHAHLYLDAEITGFNKDPSENTFPKYVANYLGMWGARERFKTSWFGKGITVSFENMQCRIPEDYDSFLKQMYGADYMTPPPVEKRVSHHDLVYFSLTSPYIK